MKIELAKLSFGKCVLILAVLGILVYSRAFFNGFVWDNEPEIVQYDAVHHLGISEIFSSSVTFSKDANIFNVYYKPLMFVVFSVVYFFFGIVPFGYHFVQIFLHIANAALVLAFFEKFYNRRWAFLLSLVFLVHPLNFESAGYIAALQDTLYFFFGMLALLFLVNDKGKGDWSFKTYAFIGLFILLALFSKEGAYLFLPIYFLYVLFFKRARIGIFAVTLVVSQIFYLLFRQVSVHKYWAYAPLPPIISASFYQMIISLPAVIFYYLSKFFFPYTLFVDSQWSISSFSFGGFFLPLILVSLFFLLLVFFAFWLHKIKSDYFKVFAFFLLWLGGSLFFYSQILFRLDMTVADRWFYVGMVGMLGLIGTALTVLDEKKMLRRRRGAVFGVLLVLVICLLAARTFVRSLNWKDDGTLYLHDLRVSPENYSLENMYAAYLLHQGDLDEAFSHLEKSVSLNPNNRDPYTNLAYYYEAKKDYEKAKQYYEHALALDNGPSDMQSYWGLARVQLFNDSDIGGARATANLGLKQNSKDTYLQAILAICDYADGNRGKALGEINRIYEQDKSEFVQKVKHSIENSLPLK